MHETYDHAGDFYFEFVQAGLADPLSMFHLSANSILALLGDVTGRTVCDVACGEGYLSRELAQRGARVTGVDLSLNLLAHAQRQAGELPIRTVRDDAQTLSSQADATFDTAVCSMALMSNQQPRASGVGDVGAQASGGQTPDSVNRLTMHCDQLAAPPTGVQRKRIRIGDDAAVECDRRTAGRANDKARRLRQFFAIEKQIRQPLKNRA